VATTYNAPHSAQLPWNQNRSVKPLRSVYHVKPGETLDHVSANTGLPKQVLIQLNSHTLGAGGVVHSGMRLQV
jgi:LysM repeat protein